MCGLSSKFPAAMGVFNVAFVWVGKTLWNKLGNTLGEQARGCLFGVAYDVVEGAIRFSE